MNKFVKRIFIIGLTVAVSNHHAAGLERQSEVQEASSNSTIRFQDQAHDSAVLRQKERTDGLKQMAQRAPLYALQVAMKTLVPQIEGLATQLCRRVQHLKNRGAAHE